MSKPTNALVEILPGAPLRGRVLELLSIDPPGPPPASCACKVQHHKNCPIEHHHARVNALGEKLRLLPAGREIVLLNGFSPRLGNTVLLDGVRIKGIG